VIRAAIALVLLGILFVPMEKLRPVRRDQRVLRTGVRTDVLHFVFTGTLGTIALVALAIVVVLPLQALTPDSLVRAVQSQPALLQLVEALLIVEVAGYWAHRLHHEIPALWKLHRVHHSSEQMDWLASAHLHPLDSATSRIVAVVPLALLGFSRETFGATLVLLQLHAIFQHANMQVRFGALGQVVSSPHFHHWHHSADLEARNRNYAGMFPWLDRIFGTYHAPGERWPSRYGIDEPMPAGYLGQLRSPFAKASLAKVTLPT
jgi:sterol desaturase/sphingolipid hydroxylase (fatty acid hydroxylase superfamily)